VPLDQQPAGCGLSMVETENLIVFSDLDGTLLDHDSYTFEEAKPALEGLKERGVPLILASSKTAAEIIPLRAELGFAGCEAIVENGAGILERGVSEVTGSTRHAEILAILDNLPTVARARFSGFSQWSSNEVAARTGLDPDAARAARIRQFSEVGTWSGTAGELAEFRSRLSAEGLSVQQGGRFVSISFGADKAARMETIADRYRQSGKSLFIVALGDAPNDIAMLEAADLGIIIPNPAHDGIAALNGEATGKILRADAPAPLGWNRSVLQLLNT
jgi:mannosyl-3-phosphoglycerate phosphatase